MRLIFSAVHNTAETLHYSFSNITFRHRLNKKSFKTEEFRYSQYVLVKLAVILLNLFSPTNKNCNKGHSIF
jgi:hypothetical protein